MLVIRLSRTGRKKHPTYRIVAADSKRAATGKFVMILGHYNPHTKELVIKKAEAAEYLKNGAQPSNAVIKLFKQEKVELPDWAQLKTRNRKPKKEAPAEVTAEAPAAEAAEAEPVSGPAEVEPQVEGGEAIAAVAEEQASAVAENASSDNLTDTAAEAQAEADTAEAASNAAADASVEANE